MSVFKKNIGPYFKSKRPNVFILFFVLALLFSVLTKLSKNYTQTFLFNINAINVPEDHVLVDKTNITFDITITTYGFQQIKYYFKEPSINVDFSKLENKGTYYEWIKNDEFLNISKQFNTNVILNNIDPDTIRFRYEVNSVKMIPLKLDSDIKFSPGYDITQNYKLDPDSVKVIGPKIFTDSIFEIKTNTLKLENVTTDVNTQISLKLPDGLSELKFSHQQIHVSAAVEKFTEGSIEVPINVINIPANIELNYYPKTVPVIYYTSLSNFKSITSSSFIIECDFNSITDQNAFLIPQIKQKPDQVKTAKLNMKRIEFIIIK